MALLEKISQMKQQGKSEPQIISQLKEEGISPREINDAISQSNVKSAISTQETAGQQGEMQPSMMQTQQEQIAIPDQKQEPQQPTQQMTQEMQQPTQQMTQEMQQPEYPEYGYQEYPQYAPEYQQSIDPETITEIASQIVDEKTDELAKKIKEIIKIKTELNFQVQKLENRMARIETIIDNLQASILQKIGEYGQNIKDIADEMHATQNSFSKILNPLTDNIRALQQISGKTPPKEKPMQKPASKTNPKRKAKKSASFEDYLR